jgi:hypothetical protein
VDENSLPVEQNGVPATIRCLSGEQITGFSSRNLDAEHEQEIDAFFAETSPGSDYNSPATDDVVRDLGAGVLREMYVKCNTRVPAGEVSRFKISVCSRVITDARVPPGDFHRKLAFLKANWGLARRCLKTTSDSRNRDAVTDDYV